jgi:hypothetical protein
VVGHSNTTPERVSLLGGQPTPIAETEFDRLYQVIIADSGEVTTVLLSQCQQLDSDLRQLDLRHD